MKFALNSISPHTVNRQGKDTMRYNLQDNTNYKSRNNNNKNAKLSISARIKDLKEHWGSIKVNMSIYGTIRNHKGPYRAIWNYTGLQRAVQNTDLLKCDRTTD